MTDETETALQYAMVMIEGHQNGMFSENQMRDAINKLHRLLNPAPMNDVIELVENAGCYDER